MPFSRRTLAVAAIVFPLVLLTCACFEEVTNYRTETVPEQVTKYRTVRRPYTEEVDVPYNEEIQVPQYRVVTQSRLPSYGRPIVVAFLPFTTSTGRPADGTALASRLESAVARHPEASSKYRVVWSSTLARTLEKSDLTRLTPADVLKIRSSLSLDYLITGHIKSQTDDQISFRLEALDVATTRPRFTENVLGSPAAAADRVVDVLYGKRVVSGSITETVSKVRKETRTLYREVQEPYKETVMTKKEVPYKTTTVNWTKTFLFGLLIVVVGANSDK
jgi:hypothetical protein